MKAKNLVSTLGLAAGLAAGAAYVLRVRPWLLAWGASPAEAAGPLPGDERIPAPAMSATRAVTIAAPPERVWPWIAQIGLGRGGFYSYDWLENVFGLEIHTADRVMPELQALKPGDLIPFSAEMAVPVAQVEPPHLLVLAGPDGAELSAGTWVFALRALAGGQTRLVVRTRVADFEPRWLSRLFYRAGLEPAHFIMERKMLLGIKERAERGEP